MADAQPKPAAELATTIQTDSAAASSPSKQADSAAIEHVEPTGPIENKPDLTAAPDSTLNNLLNDKHEDVIMNDDSVDKGKFYFYELINFFIKNKQKLAL